VDPAVARLAEDALPLGVELSPTELARFDRYLTLLRAWNARLNLTAIDQPELVITRHFLDSLTVVFALRGRATLVDVGSGAGFPGVPVAIACPAMRVTCVESVHKKAAFLQALRRELRLDLEVLAARDAALEQTYDAAVSRATWDPAEWLQHGGRLVRPGGVLIAMQSAQQAPLVAPPGFVSAEERWFTVGEARRKVHLFERR
jgi:16S rRNA (guanine527-N7)-methyltransferase